jgi:hypothetical protein
MARTTRLDNATLNVRAMLVIALGTWRLRAGRMPWQSRRAVRRHR